MVTLAQEESNDEANLILNQLQSTISNLKIRQDVLKSQIDSYSELQKKVASGTVGPSVIVHLGDGYFVDMSRRQAGNFLTRRIQSLGESSKDLAEKINHGELTMKEFQKLEEVTSNETKINEEGLPFIEIQEEIDDDGNIIEVKLNNEIISNLEARETKTEKIRSEVPDTSGKEPKELSETKLLNGADRKREAKLENISAINEKLQNGSADKLGISKSIETTEAPTKSGAKPDKPKKIVNIVEDLDEDGNVIKSNIDENTDDHDMEEINQLFEDMEIIDKKQIQSNIDKSLDQDDLLNRIDELEISAEDKFKLKQICIEEFAKLNSTDTNNESDRQHEEEIVSHIIKEHNLEDSLNRETVDSKGIGMTSTPKSTTLDIDQNDIIELEVLSSELNDSEFNDFEDENDEWEFEFDDDDDDEDDDKYTNDLFYGRRSSFEGDDKLMSKISELGQPKSIDEEETKSILKSVSTINDKKEKRKSVRFNEKLEINEIKNISEDLKQIQHVNQNFSRFKQEKILQKKSQFQVNDQKHSERDNDEPLSEFIVERDNEDPLSEFIVERNDDDFDYDSDSFSLDEQTPDFSSFEDSAELIDTSVILEEKSEEMSEDTIDESFGEPRKPSRFKQMRQSVIPSPNGRIISLESQGNRDAEVIDRKSLLNQSIRENEDKEVLQDIVEKDIVEGENDVVLDIVEKEVILDVVERDQQGQETARASRFKASMQRKPKIIGVPMSLEASQPEMEPTGPKEDAEEEKPVQLARIQETQLDYQRLQEDMDSMAQAYVLGMYDDDIHTEGPVVSEVKDFEVLNKMIESMPPTTNTESGSESTKNGGRNGNRLRNQYDPQLDSVGGDYESDDESGVISEVIEHNFEDDDYDQEEEEEAIELEIMGQEIKTEYFRMRQKMIFENKPSGFKAEEKEFEPVNESKVSRFKAARLGIGSDKVQ